MTDRQDIKKFILYYDAGRRILVVKEKGKVIPGDRLCLETRIIRKKGPMGIGEATASVGGKIVARAELTFMIGA